MKKILGGAALLLWVAGCHSLHHPQAGPPVPPPDDTVDEMGQAIDQDAAAQEKKQPGQDDLDAQLKKEQEEAQAEWDQRVAREGVPVTAQVEHLDHDTRKVTFYLKETKDEIQLQAGREMTVPFSDLPDLTGKKEDDAVDALREGTEVKLVLLGVGQATRVAKIELP